MLQLPYMQVTSREDAQVLMLSIGIGAMQDLRLLKAQDRVNCLQSHYISSIKWISCSLIKPL